MTVTRRHAGVGAVALAVVAAAWWASRPPAAPSGTSAVGPGRPATTTPGVAIVDVPIVELASLAAARMEPDDGGRDPFRFGAARAAADDRRGESAAPRRPASIPVSPPLVAVAPGSAGPPPPPPITLRFIGVVRREDDQARIAVLSDNNGVYYGREGDIIEGRYRVGRITDDTVELSYVDGRGRQVVRLAGA